jgi:hypothetical protein
MQMNKEQIEKAFAGRWRIKVENSQLSVGWIKGVKELCFDFFQTGCLLSQSEEEIEITSEDFERWWCSYDKKVGKDKAKKLWDKLSNKDKKACMEYTPAYVASTSEKRFRKNPETFLRNKSWNDEIIPHNNATNKPSLEQQRLDKLADILAG